MPRRRRRSSHRGAIAAALLVLAACTSSAPPPRAPSTASAPPARRAASDDHIVSASDLALAVGRWLGRDPEDWRYELEVQLDGTFTQTVHQGAAGGECVQEGRIEVRDDQVIRTFSSNECNTAYVGETVYDEVVSLDADAMVMRTDSGYEISYHRPP